MNFQANAVDPSGLYISTAASTFTVTAANSNEQTGTVTSAYDNDGNVTSRTWTSGLTQTLKWDAFDRLIEVSQRDNSGNGYDWTAMYDGLGRRLQTTQQPVVNNVASGSATTIASIYDPQVEFLEIGVSVNAAKAWKVYGPDLNGHLGGLQGTGGLEAVVMDSGGAATGVINDYFGNGVATISGGTVTWNTTRCGGYGPLPDSAASPLTSITQLASAVAFRGHYIDGTGFYHIGARDYEPVSGRFLSVDPLGYAGTSSLYDFGGDPVNHFDADGRCPDNGSNNGWQGVPYKYNPNTPDLGALIPIPGAPPSWPGVPDNIPDGPWVFSPNPQNSRGGVGVPEENPGDGSNPNLTWSPDGYWKYNDGAGNTQRYLPDGTPIDPSQKPTPPSQPSQPSPPSQETQPSQPSQQTQPSQPTTPTPWWAPILSLPEEILVPIIVVPPGYEQRLKSQNGLTTQA